MAKLTNGARSVSPTTTFVAVVLALAAVAGISWVVGRQSDRAASAATEATTDDTTNAAAEHVPGRPHDLPLPHTVSNLEFEKLLRKFLLTREFEKLGWAEDKRIRDTGPYIDGVYYGTHPAVRIFYSPEMIDWLVGGRKGPIADGAVMIKEQFAPPAARYEHMSEEEIVANVKSWTIMVKDKAGSYDGWYWSELSPNHEPADNKEHPFNYPGSGFGIYCIRCHTSAKSPGENPEYTFSTLNNIKGFPGNPLVYRVDDSWREPAKIVANPHDNLAGRPGHTWVKPVAAEKDQGGDGGHPPVKVATNEEHAEEYGQPAAADENPANALFVELYSEIDVRKREDIRHFPPVTHDWVVPSPDGKDDFLTSNQCMNCHAGLAAPFGPTMFVPLGEKQDYGAEGLNVSPYGEWRWSPMGLAGRDPVFHAQLESELALIDRDYADDPEMRAAVRRNVQNTCLRCHGAMGQRAHAADALAADPHAKPEFTAEHFYNTAIDPEDPDHAEYEYGALAREGIGCMICHRQEAPEQPAGDGRSYTEFFVAETNTGQLHLAEPGVLYGPYEDKEISQYGMKHGIGITPKHSAFLKSSRACAGCHTVNVPVLDTPLADDDERDELVRANKNTELHGFKHNIEQATYLEWVNSEYEDETDPNNPKARSCQSCHMPKEYKHTHRGLHVAQFDTRIATIQDETYPHADHLAEWDNIRVRVREKKSRHELLGLNAFLLEMFRQHDPILGVRKTDYMTGGTGDLDNAIHNIVEQARRKTADVTVDVLGFDPATRKLKATVDVRNKAGHRFPTGVGFRRAFLEFAVVQPGEGEAEDTVVWASGATNAAGVIVDNDGEPLPTEFFEEPKGPAPGDRFRELNRYQPHHELITSDRQVQIYEELACDHTGRPTTSFLRLCRHLKDNRLLPRGWKAEGPAPGVLTGKFLQATHPGHDAAHDPRYTDGSGSDLVTYEVTLPEGVDPTKLVVRATLYYQAMPPYYLKQRFRTAPDGEATQRLHYLVTRLNLEGTPIEGWKLKTASDESALVKP